MSRTDLLAVAFVIGGIGSSMFFHYAMKIQEDLLREIILLRERVAKLENEQERDSDDGDWWKETN